MRPAETVALQHRVGLGGEVAIGEEQQLDALPHPLRVARIGAVRRVDFMSAMLTYFGKLRYNAGRLLRYKVPDADSVLDWQGTVERQLRHEERAMAHPSPFDDRDGFIWFDGKLVPWRDAKVHVLTHALHYASCVFEGERVYGGKHLQAARSTTQRLINSAQDPRLRDPGQHGRSDRRRPRTRSSRATSIVDGYVRPVAWRGAEQMGVSAQATKIHLAIAVLGLAGLFLARGARQGHPHDVVEMGAAGAQHRADPGEGVRPLHDLHAVQARRRGRGL